MPYILSHREWDDFNQELCNKFIKAGNHQICLVMELMIIEDENESNSTKEWTTLGFEMNVKLKFLFYHY